MTRETLERYTEVRPCIVDGMPDAHTAWLNVESQSFCVTAQPCETKEEAEWMCKMLAKALARIVEDNKPICDDLTHW